MLFFETFILFECLRLVSWLVRDMELLDWKSASTFWVVLFFTMLCSSTSLIDVNRASFLDNPMDLSASRRGVDWVEPKGPIFSVSWTVVSTLFSLEWQSVYVCIFVVLAFLTLQAQNTLMRQSIMVTSMTPKMEKNMLESISFCRPTRKGFPSAISFSSSMFFDSQTVSSSACFYSFISSSLRYCFSCS